jgi:hypothetical protein
MTTSINQILNSALMEAVETENLEEGSVVSGKYKPSKRISTPATADVAAAQDKLHGTLSNPVKATVAGAALAGAGGAIANETEKSQNAPTTVPQTTPTTPSSGWSDKAIGLAKGVYAKYPNELKYGGAALAALGAGVGAVALAKKLRNKKKSIKKD